MSYLVKELAACERPYEKALAYGVETLSDAELLAVIIRTGTKNAGAITIANRVLNLHPVQKGILGLNYISRRDLKTLPGVGDTKATELLAVAEISRRIRERTFQEQLTFNEPESVGAYYLQKCRFQIKEQVYAMLLSSGNALLKEWLVSEGTEDKALISARHIFSEALKYEAAGVILVHNHPSGNPFPSEADISLTKQLLQAGKLLDIRLLDHIIVGKNNYISLRQKGDIFEN